jgi:hypothetical protein
MECIKILKAIRDDNDSVSVSPPTCIAVCEWQSESHFFAMVNILKAIRDDSDSVSPPTCIAICVCDNLSHTSLQWSTLLMFHRKYFDISKALQQW